MTTDCHQDSINQIVQDEQGCEETWPHRHLKQNRLNSRTVVNGCARRVFT